ncbi:MAG: hypothetical protein M0D55_17140 [Elusimicrobiota bacterium]|nr:MAG: hypothetical protein M0D55_17140 [Elusimicrobiota bacterium]
MYEALPEGFVPLSQLRGGEKIAQADWQSYNDAVTALGRAGLGGVEAYVRVGKGGRAEFVLTPSLKTTLRGDIDALSSHWQSLKGPEGLETRMIASGVLERPARLPDPRQAAMARNQVPMAQKLAEELSAAMAAGDGVRPPPAERARSRRFTDLGEAAAYLGARDGVHLLAKTSEGLAGDAVRVEIGGADWYLKRVSKKLNESIDDSLRALKPEERAGNELAIREIVRQAFPETFHVAPEALTIEHRGEIWVLTKGAPAAPDPARIAKLTPEQRADYALLRLVLNAKDINRGNILFPKGEGKPTLIDFEAARPEVLDAAKVAREADNEIFVKGFPLVSLEGNNPAVYKARADLLRARAADPEFRARLESILVDAGWAAERRAKFHEAFEANLRNFEANVAPYLAIAQKTIAKRRAEGSAPPTTASCRTS